MFSGSLIDSSMSATASARRGCSAAAGRISSSTGSIAFGSRSSTRPTSITIMFEVPSQMEFSGASR